MSEILEYALRYAQSGRVVIPLHDCHTGKCSCGKTDCQSPGKHPRLDKWPAQATTDAITIREWFTKWPYANLGLPLGGLVVIDVDPRNGGEDTFGDLIAQYGTFTETWTQKTGGGGWHYIFRANGDKYRGALGAGVDLKFGSAQFIVVEPSIHASGHRYVFVDESAPFEGGKLADAPKWLSKVEMQSPMQRSENGSIIMGSRNNYLYERARRLRDLGLSQNTIAIALHEINLERCMPPLDKNEVITIAKSAGQNEPEIAFGDNFRNLKRFLDDWGSPIWLVKGILQKGLLYAITALTNHGKTALAIELALCVTTGAPFGGEKTTKGKVLYLCGENPDNFRERLLASCQYSNVDIPSTSDNFIVYPRADDLSHIVDGLEAFCNDWGGVSLIIVDTSVSYSALFDENSNTEALKHAQSMRKMISFAGSPAVLALCHPSKDAAKDKLFPRGGSAFMNELDANLTVWKDEKTITLDYNKIRGPEFKPQQFEIKQFEVVGKSDSDGLPIISAIVQHLSDSTVEHIHELENAENEALLKAINERSGQTHRWYAVRLGWVSSSGDPYQVKVTRKIRKLKEAGLVEILLDSVQVTAKGKKYFYEKT